jgi:DNA-binding transcriptional LysR family regulator
LRILLEQYLADLHVAHTVAVETTQRDALVPLVLAGAGTAVLPAPLAAAGRAAGAVVRPLDPPIHRQLVVVHRSGPLSPAAASFIALATSP